MYLKLCHNPATIPSAGSLALGAIAILTVPYTVAAVRITTAYRIHFGEVRYGYGTECGLVFEHVSRDRSTSTVESASIRLQPVRVLDWIHWRKYRLRGFDEPSELWRQRNSELNPPRKAFSTRQPSNLNSKYPLPCYEEDRRGSVSHRKLWICSLIWSRISVVVQQCGTLTPKPNNVPTVSVHQRSSISRSSSVTNNSQTIFIWFKWL
jgi:hypothetical protein